MRRSSSREEDPAGAGGWWRGAGIATALGGRAAAKPSPLTPRGKEGAAARQATAGASASRSPSPAPPRQATASTGLRRFSRPASGGGGPQQPVGKEDQPLTPRPKARGRPAEVEVSSPAASPLVSPSASAPSSPPTSPRGAPRAPVKVSVAAAKVAAQADKDPAVAPSVKAEAPAAKAPAAKAAAPAAKTAAPTAKAPAKAGGAPAVKAAPASAVKAEPAPTVKAASAPAVKAASVTVVKVGPVAAAKALPAASAKAPVGAPEVKAAAPAMKALTVSKAPAAKAPAAKAAQAPAAAAQEDGPSASRVSTQGRTGLAGSFFAAVGLTSSRAAAGGAAASPTDSAGTASAVADAPPATSTSVPLVPPPQEVLSAMPARAEQAEENPPSPSASSTARAGLTGSLLAAVRLTSASTASPPAPSAPVVVSVVRPVGGREDSVDKGQLKKTSKAKEAEDTNSLQSASTKSDEADATSLPSSASTPSSSETPSSASSDFKEGGTRKYRLKHEIYIPKYQPEDILWQNEGQLVKFHHEVALPLLKATTPVPTGWLRGQFRLTLQRATPYQPFGITFLASDARSRFVIAEDLPHLGLEKGDELVTINQASPSSIHDVRKILKHSMTSELTIWRQVQETGEVKQRPFTCCAAGQPQPAEDGSGKPRPVPEVKNKLLLAMLRPQVINEDKGEFRLVMQRFSLTQQFGLEFVSEPSKRKPASMVVLPADFPHLGLRKGDRLISINGVEPRTLVHCQHIYDNSLNLTLIFRRNPRGLVHLSALVERIEEEPGAAAALAPVVEEVPVPERGWFGGTLHCGAWGSACQGAGGRSLPAASKPTSPLAGPR